MADLSGTTLKGYELQERIGTGGFGAVYRAIQSTVGREVAVKIILPGYANQPVFIRRFETEAQIIARLEHLHIVPLHDYWRDPNGAYIVMRYLRGGSLRDLLAQGALDLETTALLLDQISSALTVAHRNQVIHRDIKPANILLDEDGNGYLADFGIAKELTVQGAGLTGPDAMIGSPDYLAPEQARSDPVSPQTDIYSLGIVLYEMLTGEHPFPHRSRVERLYAHLNEPMPEIQMLDETVSDDINSVIERATTKDPARRFADVMALATAFREAAALGISRVELSLVELLTPREQEVLKLIIKGKTNREIADKLTVEISTVKTYVNHIYRKLNVRSRVQAIVKAREMNLIVDEFEGGAAATTTYIQLPPLKNPYKGLRAFTAADEKDFFGRERMVSSLLAKMAQDGDYSRFLAVVGPSGSGKSSLVKAGFIPALWRGELDGSDNWYIVDFIPGAHPLDELEVALMRIASDQSLNLGDQLIRDERGLLRSTQLLLPDDGSELLIVIDQFEEVFTLVEDEAQRAHFLDLLHSAVTAPRSRVRVVVTMRADFYDRPLHYPAFGELMRERVETVLPLGAEELERAIVEPARQVGVGYEEGLVASIISEINYQPGALPLLQYALTELFEAHENRQLTHEAYESIGRAVGALATRAEETHQEFDDAGQETARQMFLRLVTLGEGVEDTRRRVNRAELLAIADDPDLMDEVIDTFAAYRLLSLDHDPASRRPTVEVAHEALLREWERLRNWLNESRADIRLQQQLARAAQEWREAEQDPSFLLRGARLEQFEGWSAATGLALTQAERDYLQASLKLRDAEAQAEAERQAREESLERRAQNVLRVLVGVFAVAAIAAGGLAFYANQQRQEALRQASIGLAALAEQELQASDRELGLLLALEAVEHYPHTPQAAGALARAVDEYRAFLALNTTEVMGTIASVATWSPDGKRVALGASPNPDSLVIWDPMTDSIELSVNTHGDLCNEAAYFLYDLAWSPDGERLAGAARTVNSQERCGVVVLDPNNGETLLTIVSYDSPAWSVDWSPDGTTLLTAHEDGFARLWNADTGAEQLVLDGPPSIIYDAVFSPDGTRVATASEDGTVQVWNTATGTEQIALTGHVGSVYAVDWSPDNSRIVTGGHDTLLRIWDVATGEPLSVLAGHTEAVVAVNWSLDGRQIASQSFDGTVRVWDAATGGFMFEIANSTPDPDTKTGYVEFSPDGQWILTGGSRVLGTHIWDASLSVPMLFGHSFGQEWGAWSPDGMLIATSGTDGSARLWDATTGEQLKEFDQGSYWGDWSPDGRRLVVAEGPGFSALNVWDVESGERLSRLTVADDEYGSRQFLTMDWSPNGEFITAAGFRPGTPQALYVWDAETFELVATLRTDDVCMLGWPRWSPDSTRIATGCIFVAAGVATPARVWDIASGEEVMVLESDNGWSYRTIWSPDGSRLLVAYEDGTEIIWDVESSRPVLTFAKHQGGGGVTSAWSPDGTLIVSGDYASQFIKVWNSETGEELLSFSVPGAPLTVNWSPDGTHVIVTADGMNEPLIKRIWASTDDLVTHAYECCVNRELTPEERVQFGLSLATAANP